jgi:hypothetical protein
MVQIVAASSAGLQRSIVASLEKPPVEDLDFDKIRADLVRHGHSTPRHVTSHTAMPCLIEQSVPTQHRRVYAFVGGLKAVNRFHILAMGNVVSDQQCWMLELWNGLSKATCRRGYAKGHGEVEC